MLAQPLFYVVHLLPGPFISSFKWTMAIFGAAALVSMVAAMRAPLWRIVVAAAVAGVSPLLVGPVFLNTYDLFRRCSPSHRCSPSCTGVSGRRTCCSRSPWPRIYPIVIVPIVLSCYREANTCLYGVGR